MYKSPHARDIVLRMNDIQQHRGPDYQGIYQDEHCILGHTRLSIIDLSSDGHQPFVSADNRYYMIYNGEIYNYIELREHLKQEGFSFRTQTDTEVLLAAYQHYGTSCLHKLNGMFAFCVYDQKTHILFIARDRVGIKPFYYIQRPDGFYFASEIKALLSIPNLTPCIHHQSLFDYLVFNRTDVFQDTFIEDIYRLPAGHYGILDEQHFSIHQWWHPELFINSSKETSLQDIQDHIRELLVSSVALRMRSDVPVGTCLSGGLDSSIIVGTLFEKNLVNSGFQTFTASFPNQIEDETRYVNTLNQRFPFQSHLIFPTSQNAYENLYHFTYTNDEPVPSPSFYAQYEVMKYAHDQHITVLLDGQGGDENFAGYHYFNGFFWFELFKTKQFVRFVKEIHAAILKKTHSSAYQTFGFLLAPAHLKKKLLKLSVPYMAADFFDEYIEKSMIWQHFFCIDSLNQSILRHFQYKLEHLLRIEDRNSMAFSLEARLPYLDYRLIEYLLSVPGELKIMYGQPKYLQKASLGQFTVQEILQRKDKQGFEVPCAQWMKGETWQSFFDDCYENLSQSMPTVFCSDIRNIRSPKDHWKMCQLQVWRDVFNVQS
ncbi:MAG: asparagine synthase (glutamine-hydrolyzing) [Desulfobacterales bacterium]|nr:asparagine synthase (glutamine-hydrolyzing) [Desulfobacterales bacterium]